MGLHNRGHLDKIYDQVDFYQHQVEGVRQMARMGSFLLADEMGLGKSLQALTVAAVDFERGYAKRIIIICPASLKWNWQDEMTAIDPDYGVPKTSFSCMVLDGTPEERNAQLDAFEMYEYDVLIVNYEQVGRHIGRLNALSFDIGIWDEAQYLKNPDSKRTQASMSLHVKRAFVLTGSPMLNQVNELWSLLHRILPAQFPDYKRFVNRYCVFGGYKGKSVTGVKNKEELLGLLDNVMIRRLKKDVLDLPPKQHIIRKVPLSPAQKALYDEAMDELKISTAEGMDDMELENALTKFLRLKQICGTSFDFTGEDHSSKMDLAEEMAQEIVLDGESEPLVIFTQFRSIIALMRGRLEKMGITCFEIHGDVPKEQRPAVVKRWGKFRDKNGKAGVIIVGLVAGGVGLNMTYASKCIFLDKLFVPKLNEQAEDRLHRIGAVGETIQIFEIVCKGTIESRIESILKRKRRLFDTVVENVDWKRTLVEEVVQEDD